MFKNVIVVLVLGVSGAAQTNAAKPAEGETSFPAYTVKLVVDGDMPVLPLSDNPLFRAYPGQCDADRNPYLKLRGMRGQEEVGLTRKGVITFSPDKMTDIPEPKIDNFFVAESAVYFIASGLENVKEEPYTSIDPATNQPRRRIRRTGTRPQFIVRFDKDGTYRSTLRLDLPFFVMQIAVFNSGNYVAAGVDNDKVPRVALLNGSGRLQKYLELEKDLGNRAKSARKNVAAIFGGDSGADTIAMLANLYAYGEKVLLVRTSTGTPVYEIRDGGEARAVTIKPPTGYTLWGLIPSDKTWVADLAKRAATGGLSDAEHVFYEVNPETGELVRELRLERDPKIQPACWDGSELTAIRHADNRITILRGTPEPATAKQEPE